MAEVKKVFTQEKFYVEYQVEKRLDNVRLDQFIQNYFPTFSRQFIKKKIEKNEILILGRTAKNRPSTKVKLGDIVSFVTFRKEMEDEYWVGEKIIFENPSIIYEDQNLLVINKPPFMATHPTGRHLFYCATTFYENIYGHTIHSLHRLDRETSGVLLLGKNPKVSNLVTSEFESNNVLKCYFLIAKASQSLDKKFPFWAKENLGRNDEKAEEKIDESDNRLIIQVYPEGSNMGKEASTYFECILKTPHYLMALAFPKTGRQHQIRAHAAFHKFALLGDKLYLGNADLFGRFKDRIASQEDHDLVEISHQALHAMAINFFYANEEKTFFAPLPLDLKNWIKLKLNFSEEDLVKMESNIKEKILSYFKFCRK